MYIWWFGDLFWKRNKVYHFGGINLPTFFPIMFGKIAYAILQSEKLILHNFLSQES